MTQSVNLYDPIRSPITRIPKEILTAILLEANYDVLDILIPEDCYLNRYTKQAKILRQVCQLWKNIVDLTSNYPFRMTTAFLLNHAHAEPEKLEGFRRQLDSAKSLIAAKIHFKFSFVYDSAMEENRRQLKSITLVAIKHLLSIQDRLYKIEGEFADLELETNLFKILDSMRSSSPLSFATIKGGIGYLFLRKSSNDNILKAESQNTRQYKLPPSLIKLKLFNCQDRLLKNLDMRSLSQIELGTPPPSTVLSVLETCRRIERLKVNLNIRDPYDFLIERPTLLLDSLQTLEIIVYPLTAIIQWLSKLKCISLRHLRFDLTTPGSYNWDTAPHGSGVGLSYPSLKYLDYTGPANFSIFLLASLVDIPVLERLSITAFHESDTQDIISRDLSNAFSPLRTKSLCFPFTTLEYFSQLRSLLDFSSVESLQIDERTVGKGEDGVPEFTFTNTRKLTVSVTKLKLLPELLQVNSGSSLRELEIQKHPDFDDMNQTVHSPGWQYWRSFVSREIGKGTYNSVTTLSVAWPPGWDKLFTSLLELCKNTHTLHLQYLHIYGGFQVLHKLESLHSTEEYSSKGIVVPNLRTIIMGFGIPDDLDGWLKRSREELERVLPTFAEARRRAGADPLHTVILRHPYSEFKKTSQNSFLLDCGIRLYFETI